MFSHFPFSSGINELNGVIPFEIGSLRALMSLGLGMYYQSVKCLSLLLLLYLHSHIFPAFLSVENELNGQIPTEIGSLRALRDLSLGMYYQSVKCLCLVLYFDLHSCSKLVGFLVWY